MLSAITSELRAALVARSVPFPVVYGPEQMAMGPATRSHIVVERDRSRGDSVEAPPVHMTNPRLISIRWIGARMRIFARATVAGSNPAGHERLADRLVDQILASMRIIISDRKTFWRVVSCRLLTALDLEQDNLQTWPGVVYEMTFDVARGVTDATYATFSGETETGTAAGEAEMGADGGPTTSTTLDTSDSPEGHSDLPGATVRL